MLRLRFEERGPFFSGLVSLFQFDKWRSLAKKRDHATMSGPQQFSEYLYALPSTSKRSLSRSPIPATRNCRRHQLGATLHLSAHSST